MKLLPLYDRVIIKRLELPATTQSGLIIPDSAKEKPQRGEVIAVGEGRLMSNGTLIPLKLKIGDTVLFGKFAGSLVRVDNQELLLMKEEDIFAVTLED